MPLRVNEQIPRSLMLLCLGTAGVLLVSQMSGFSSRLAPTPVGIVRARSVKSQETVAAKPVNLTAAQVVPAPKTAPPPQSDAKLVVDLSDRQVNFYRKGELVGRYPLAVAMAGWETPTGSFHVLNMEQNPTWIHPITGETVAPGPDNPLGKAWIGFWTDGESEIGFHGTNQEELIGEAVSHGCLRMRNADIQALYAQVSEGTPVTVQQ